MVEGVAELSGLGVLTWVYPPDVVDRVVAACGRSEQRRRLLPARLVVYFVLALALFSPAPYLEVLRHLVEGLRGVGRWGAWRIPAKSSLFRARERLGAEPLRVLFAATAHRCGCASGFRQSAGVCSTLVAGRTSCPWAATAPAWPIAGWSSPLVPYGEHLTSAPHF